ncbi:MAG: TIR domain-containing protein [Chloroflexi bacterium]|nr:TIR domain-containing protein [Chloroflexota bacterium]
MGKIFINYRHADSPDLVDRIYERLVDPVRGLKDWGVFRDINSLGPGDLEHNIQESLVSCDVVLVIIGPKWKKLLNGRPSETDIARHEMRVALCSDAIVIPVLVGGASLPRKLPNDLKKLATLLAFTVRTDPDFDQDMDRLMDAILSLPDAAPVSQSEKKRRLEFDCHFILMFALALACAGCFFLGGQVIPYVLNDHDAEATRTARAYTQVAMAYATGTASVDVPTPMATNVLSQLVLPIQELKLREPRLKYLSLFTT